MRADELTWNELVARFAAQRVVPVRRTRITKVSDDGILFVEEGDTPVQIRDHDETVVLVEVTRQPEAGDEIEVPAVEREALQPVIAPVGHNQGRSCMTRLESWRFGLREP